MEKFKIGDIVGWYYEGVAKPAYTAEIIAERTIKIISYPKYKEYVGREHTINYNDPHIRLLLTKEEKFAISKNRVETRHLRKKTCQ